MRRILSLLLLSLLIVTDARADLKLFIANRLIASNAKTSPIILGTTNSLDADWTSVAPTLMYTVDSGLSTPAIAIGKFGADAYAQQIQFYKTRSASATMDANTIIANGDALGTIRWSGSDGASYREAAAIIARVSAAPGASDMPTDLEFWTTPDGAFSATQKWTITQAGNLLQDSSSGGNLLVSRLGASSTGQMAMFGGGTTSYNADITGTQYPTVLISQSPAAGSLDWSGIAGRGATANGPQWRFLKTRSTSTTLDANTVVNSGDQLGVIPFYGSDGAAYALGAQIVVDIDATPGSGDMPSRMDFQVSADGSATPVSALKLSDNLQATFGGVLSFSTAASRIVPGGTSLSLRNNANNADNLIITDAGLATFRGNIYSAGVTGSTFQILSNSVDATDSNILQLSPASAVGVTRGAYLSLPGNEATGIGAFTLSAGQVASSHSYIDCGSSSSDCSFIYGGVPSSVLWKIDVSSGRLSNGSVGADLALSTTGTTVSVQEGTAASACMGTLTCNGASDVTTNTTCATSASRIFLTRTSLDADTTGDYYVKSISNNTSFTVACEASDTATLNWIIFHEAP